MIIACRERGWFDPRTDFRIWDNLCRSFDVPLQLVERVTDMEFPPDRVIVVLDETGDIHLSDFLHPENAAYVFGPAGSAGLQQHVPADFVVRVDTPHDKGMFGVSVAGMVLYDRMLKS